MTTRVAMGGTFDHFHRGHRALLETAFREGDETVQIGITRGDLATRGRDRTVRSWDARAGSVRAFLDERGWSDRGRVVPIEGPFGFALEPEWDALVVTRETASTGDAINAERVKHGLPPLVIRVAPYVLADDGLPLKATRIALGEVDGDGRLVEPAVVAVGSTNPVKVTGARTAFGHRWDSARVVDVDASSGVPEQPIGAATWDGALARAKAAFGAVEGAHFGVGLEAGLLPHGPEGTVFDVQACAVVDRGGRVTWGHSTGFTLPAAFVQEARETGRTVGDSVGALADDPDVGRKGGAVAYLTGGVLTRTTLCEEAVLAALVPRMNAEAFGFDVEETPPAEPRSGAQTERLSNHPD